MTLIDHRWALVLAAGEGQRLRRLTTTRNGLAVPKQFCSLERGPSLLHEALRRASASAEPDRICAIVAAQHRHWWTGQLEGVPSRNIVVQPLNRGTANGVLLPLLKIVERDPGARITLLPSDHDVRDEAQLAWALRAACGGSPSAPRAWSEFLLLGLAPRSPDPELGYIVPGAARHGRHYAVERFVEKPLAPIAATLIAQGALWNSFIIAADAQALLKLFERRCPQIVSAMREALRASGTAGVGDSALTGLYEQLPSLDFSRDVLSGQEQHLRVLPVPECGWSDLGTPERVAEALREPRPRCRRSRGADPVAPVLLSLSVQYRRLHGASTWSAM